MTLDYFHSFLWNHLLRMLISNLKDFYNKLQNECGKHSMSFLLTRINCNVYKLGSLRFTHCDLGLSFDKYLSFCTPADHNIYFKTADSCLLGEKTFDLTVTVSSAK